MSTSNALEKKQLDIILKLNRLTQEGKLEWKKGINPMELEEEYYATFRNRRFALTKIHPLYSAEGGTWGLTKSAYRLSVFEKGQDKPLSEIPPIPATKDLIASIKRKLEEPKQEQLQSLEELDDWLSEQA